MTNLKRLLRSATLLVTWTLAICPAHAADALAPPDWQPQIDQNAYGDGDARPEGQVKLGELSVSVSSTSLQTLRKALGIGRIQHAEIDSHESYWLCYTSQASVPRQRVWFSGSTESAVQERGNVIETVVVVALSAKEHASARCPLLPARFAAIDLGHGAAIGADVDSLAAIEPPLVQQGELRYEYRRFSNHHWGVEQLWAIRVVDGRVVGLRTSEFVRS